MLYNSSVSHFFVNFLTYVTTPFHQPGIIWALITRNHLSSLEEKLAPWRPRSSAFPSLWGFLTPRPERTCLAGPGGGGLLVWCFWVVAFFFNCQFRSRVSLCSLSWLLTLHSPPTMQGLRFRWAPSHPNEEHISHLFSPLPLKSDTSSERVNVMNHPILGC